MREREKEREGDILPHHGSTRPIVPGSGTFTGAPGGYTGKSAITGTLFVGVGSP